MVYIILRDIYICYSELSRKYPFVYDLSPLVHLAVDDNADSRELLKATRHRTDAASHKIRLVTEKAGLALPSRGCAVFGPLRADRRLHRFNAVRVETGHLVTTCRFLPCAGAGGGLMRMCP